MIASAQAVAILADSSKFGRRGLGKVCDFDQVDYIITDSGVAPGIVKQLHERGLKVIVAQ
jgi:DeoR family transcriptional regulator of aga operon